MARSIGYAYLVAHQRLRDTLESCTRKDAERIIDVASRSARLRIIGDHSSYYVWPLPGKRLVVIGRVYGPTIDDLPQRCEMAVVYTLHQGAIAAVQLTDAGSVEIQLEGLVDEA